MNLCKNFEKIKMQEKCNILEFKIYNFEIFSIKKDYLRLVFTILGIKIKFFFFNSISKPIDIKLVESINNNILSNTVLMIEANDFHGEIIPGYISYLLDLGYNVDLLTTEKHKQDEDLCLLKSPKIQEYYTNIDTIEKILSSKDIMDKYVGLFINTVCLFRKDRRLKSPSLIYKYFNNLSKPQNGFCINICHAINYLPKNLLNKNICATLSQTKFNLPVINPCCFGNINITEKNQKIIFLASGDLRRNFSNLEDIVQKLLDENITNFEIYITGRNKYELKNKVLSSYIKFCGYLKFNELYNLVEKSDYILPCLDPQNSKHNWYLTNGTSGCFQLSYGFLKPMIIAKKFANKALVDEKSAIIHEDNTDLAKVMVKAIEMDNYKYKQIQDNLAHVKETLYMQSKKTLKSMIEQQVKNV